MLLSEAGRLAWVPLFRHGSRPPASGETKLGRRCLRPSRVTRMPHGNGFFPIQATVSRHWRTVQRPSISAGSAPPIRQKPDFPVPGPERRRARRAHARSWVFFRRTVAAFSISLRFSLCGVHAGRTWLAHDPRAVRTLPWPTSSPAGTSSSRRQGSGHLGDRILRIVADASATDSYERCPRPARGPAHRVPPRSPSASVKAVSSSVSPTYPAHVQRGSQRFTAGSPGILGREQGASLGPRPRPGATVDPFPPEQPSREGHLHEHPGSCTCESCGPRAEACCRGQVAAGSAFGARGRAPRWDRGFGASAYSAWLSLLISAIEQHLEPAADGHVRVRCHLLLRHRLLTLTWLPVARFGGAGHHRRWRHAPWLREAFRSRGASWPCGSTGRRHRYWFPTVLVLLATTVAFTWSTRTCRRQGVPRARDA